MTADGSTQTRLITDPGIGSEPNWGTGPVGGIAELPAVAGTPLETGGSPGRSAGGLAGVAAAGATAPGGAAGWGRRPRRRV